MNGQAECLRHVQEVAVVASDKSGGGVAHDNTLEHSPTLVTLEPRRVSDPRIDRFTVLIDLLVRPACNQAR